MCYRMARACVIRYSTAMITHLPASRNYMRCHFVYDTVSPTCDVVQVAAGWPYSVGLPSFPESGAPFEVLQGGKCACMHGCKRDTPGMISGLRHACINL